TDVVGLEELQREFGAFQKVLSEKTGYTFKLFPVTGRTVVAETFRSGKLDFALTGPSEYVIIKNRSDTIPVIGLSRPDYYSVIITRKDSGIHSLAELKGKKIAFGDYGSTSYHLAPLQILSDAGLNPTTDLESVNVGKLVAWKSLVRGKVDAIGLNQDRFRLFSEQEQGVSENDFEILGRSPELPNDLIMAAPHVPKAVIEKVKTVFAEHGDEILQAILVGPRNNKYQEMKFLTKIQDSDYDYIRQMYKTAGFAEFASPVQAG
ncbi:MAG: phosphate/phosphite/phosphonate ABC transporter substrate-binding protein, partial [Bdellovibrionales bacterium]|nr:phosphate/phosphite/phosphonate ABC transporter substrate-binding protein [Bdellovibrionales bacterium]